MRGDESDDLEYNVVEQWLPFDIASTVVIGVSSSTFIDESSAETTEVDRYKKNGIYSNEEIDAVTCAAGFDELVLISFVSAVLDEVPSFILRSVFVRFGVSVVAKLPALIVSVATADEAPYLAVV